MVHSERLIPKFSSTKMNVSKIKIYLYYYTNYEDTVFRFLLYLIVQKAESRIKFDLRAEQDSGSKVL